MRFRYQLSIMFSLLMLLGVAWCAQAQEVTIGKIDFPERVWGEQTMAFEVTNNSEWLKFMVVQADIAFEGSYVNPTRERFTNFVLEPAETKVFRPVLEIPGNYGTVTVWLRIYDVVDTLDDLSLGTQLFEQPFKMQFHTPEGVLPYFKERITLPPMTERSPMLDNEFARLMVVMSQQGKTVDEIAALTGADTTYVRLIGRRLVRERILAYDRSGFKPDISVITQDEAKDGRQLAENTAGKLATLITENWPAYRQEMDSLVKTGKLSKDSTNFFEGGTVLYMPYPMISGMLLWYDLGQTFINGGKPIFMFNRTGPCKPDIGEFMYIVQGGDYYSGHHYFAARPTKNGQRIRFGDEIPSVTCNPGYSKKANLHEGLDWSYDEEYAPESFYFDLSLVNPPMKALEVGTHELLNDVQQQLQKIDRKYGNTIYRAGVRFWFWNLTATLTLEKLVSDGFVQRSGNGQFNLVKKD